MIYQTKENEVLDYICWNHYFRADLLNSLLVQETEYYDPAVEIMEIFNITNMTSRADNQMGEIVNKVLDANPGLINHGIFLPAGLQIQLPDIKEAAVTENIVQLWD